MARSRSSRRPAPDTGGGGLPFTFSAGSKARANEVNANFEALAQCIVDLELEKGANVHVRSGSGATDDGGSPTGVGNFIVGYNELGNLSPADRTGAHNLVMGSRNAYTNVAGSVAGTDNTIEAPFAAILSGSFGTVSGRYSTITGGGGESSNLFNTVTGEFASVAGGFRNVASGNQSTVAGGSNHEAAGSLSSVTGGTANVASGAGATVSGGAGNVAQGANCAISGGQGGFANGVSASISGGLDREVLTNFDCADCND